MELNVGLIFEMRNVKLNSGKVFNIYKLVDVDFGFCFKVNGCYTFLPINSNFTKDLLYQVCDVNKEILKDTFNKEGYYVGVLYQNDLEEYLKKTNYDINKVKETLFKEWGGESYLYFRDGFSFSKVKNPENINLIEEVFKNRISNKNNVFSFRYNELMKYGVFLTDNEYLFNPAIGREFEIERLERTLLGYDSSGILVGESGVGKTAIVEGLAYKIQNGLVHDKLKNYKIISISTSSMVSGCRYVGDLEKRMETIINELKNNKDIIMFIDEIHTVIGTGKGEKSNLDIANILKPHLDRGDIKIIGSTTSAEYENLINDNAFKRRFKKINVLEPDEFTLYIILDGVICGLEKHYNIEFNFLGDVKSRIYRILYELTSKKSIDFKEQANNPYLILSIIKDAFSIADYKYHAEITIDDLIQAINETDRIYPSVRERFKMELKKVSLVDEVNKESFVKILKLPSVDKNSLT